MQRFGFGVIGSLLSMFGAGRVGTAYGSRETFQARS